jgi:hypothetical protein
VPTVSGGAENNTYYLRVDPADADRLQAFKSSTPVGSPAYTMFRNDDRPLTINSGGGDDELIIDFSNGNPLPDAGLRFDGGAGNNRLRIVGTRGKENLAVDPGRVFVDSSSIDYDNASIQLGWSNDTTPMALAGLDLQGSARITFAGSGLLQLDLLAIAPEATLDLGEGDLRLSPAPEARQAVYEQITQWIRNARSNGTWVGNGLTSTFAQVTPQTGLSILLNDDAGRAILDEFVGVPVGTNDILIKYTWNGDVNLDGIVDAADYFLVDSGFLTQQGGYRNGDLNFDGEVDAADYFLIDSAFLAQTGVVAAEETPVSQQLFSVDPVLSTETQDILG